MSILIKGMAMPKSCDDCKLRNGMGKGDGKVIYHCAPLAKWVVPNPLAETNDCPLVPVPPHGRLIDVDALTDAIESTDWYHQAPNKEMVHGANSAEHQAWYKEQDIYSALENAPTIIEAEEGET